MKKQVIAIHGGDTFATYEEYLKFLNDFELDLNRCVSGSVDWKVTLSEKLGVDYEVFTPRMPNPTNAQYSEWKLWLEKILALLGDEVIFIGHSLGASFLAKYLSENKVEKKALGVFLVAGVFDTDEDGYDLASFSLPEKLNMQSDHVFIYHSKDDPVVPFSALSKFHEALPSSHTRELDGRGHINQSEFPELVADIKSL